VLTVCRTDTERLYTVATEMILEPYGKAYPFEVKEQVMGLQTEPLSRFMVEHFELPISWEEYARQQRANAEILMRNAQLMPGTNPRSRFTVTFQTRSGYTRRSPGK